MRKFAQTALLRKLPVVIALIFSALGLFSQTTITTLPDPPYNGGNGLGAPAQVSFVVNNTNAFPIALTGVSSYCQTSDINSVWELYYTAVELSGSSADISVAPWYLAATSQPTVVTAEGITPINFTGLNFEVPANTRYRFALRNTGPGNIRYSGSGSSGISPNTFSADGVVLELGDFQVAGQDVGWSGAGTSLDDNSPRSFTGAITFETADPCVTPPIPGIIKSSESPVCTGKDLTLYVTGGTGGSSQTYQWESAPAAAGPWSPVPGAQNSPVLHLPAPATNTWYRLSVTCGGNTQSSAPFQQLVNPNLPAGTYTINAGQATGGTNYQSFADAVAALGCGIAGPVVFNVVPNSGPYTEQVRIGEIINASSINTVTFNGNGNTIQFNSTTSSERAVIKLLGADHIIFDSLTIDASGGTYGFGFHIMEDADSNTIRRCTVISSTTSTSSGYAGIAMSNSHTSATTSGDSRCDGNLIMNNTITGGYYGITLVGSSSSPVYNNRIVNNTITDFHTYGIYLNGQVNALVEGSDIYRPARTELNTFYGIYVTQAGLSLNITRNRIHNPFDGNPTVSETFYGIYFTGVDGVSGSENVVSNNIIYNINGESTEYGIYNSSSDYALYYHNSISLDNTSSNSNSTTRGFYQTSEATGIQFFNNLVTISRGGPGTRWAIYMGNSATDFIANNNNYFVSGDPSETFTGYNGDDQVTLADWKAATGQEAASVAIDPQYTDLTAGNLTPTSAFMSNLGQQVGITVDIIGAARNATAPDIGAFEYMAPPCTTPPVPGTTTTSATPVCAGATFTLGLTGGTAGGSQTYQWESAAAAAGPFTPMGAAQPTPFFEVTATITRYYRCAVSCSGNTQYSAPLQVVVTPRLGAGTYTINAGQPANGVNFSSFTEVAAALSCGITGPVVFNVAPNSGPYTEQFTIFDVPGASAVNTITFNGNGNTVQFAPTISDERHVIRLNGADHITFDSLIVNAAEGNYGFGIHLLNNADSNTIKNVIVNGNTTSSSSSYAGIVISASLTGATTSGNALCDGNTIINNTVNGGNYGITVVGGSSDPTFNNKVVNNTVRDFDEYGIYLSYQVNALVEDNDISRPNRTSMNTFYGIYVSSGGESLQISKNRIHNPFDGDLTSTSNFYGIYFTSADAEPATPNTVSNNLVYNVNGDGDEYGLYNFSSSNVRYYHNTLSFDNQSSNHSDLYWTRAIYQTSSATGIEYRNNMVTVTRSGDGDRHAIYMNTSATEYTADYNNYFVSGPGGVSWIGRDDGNDLTTMSAWQAATGQDANSLNFEPGYASPATVDFSPTNPFLHDLGTPVGITTDINNASRSATKPDIGAFEFTAAPCVNPPVPGTINPVSQLCSPTQEFKLSVTGGTAGAGQTYQWQSSPDNVTWTDIPGATRFMLTTTQAATTWYRLVVTCGVSVPSAALQVISSKPDYTTLPYTESFESWIDGCDIRDIPNNFWRNTPTNGNQSWRRNDEGATASWTSVDFGDYSPVASHGAFSARFHTYEASEGTSGILDLYVNCATTEPNKRITFDYINTTGDDSLQVMISTDGGNTFTRLAGYLNSADWAEQSIDFAATSATTVIRFMATSDWGLTDIGIDDLAIFDLIDCSGSPDAGTTSTTSNNVCPGSNFTLSTTGAPIVQGVTYQWQSSPDNVTWTDLSSATEKSLTTTQIANTWYRVAVTCTESGLSNTSNPLLITMNAADYTNLPYSESFETWIDGCATRDIPNNFWRNDPVTGDSSWRRNDDGDAAEWATPGSGDYSPEASAGDYSARFHTYQADEGNRGRLNLYFDASTGVATKRLTFDYINTSGDDSLVVYLSEDGGATWTRLDSLLESDTWRTKAIIFDATSSTSVLRFEATSDFGGSDIGIDNLSLVDWQDCAGTPVGGIATSSVTNVCSEPFTLGVNGISSGKGITYQWQMSSDSTNWTDIQGATDFSLTTTQVGTSWYRIVAYCSFSNSSGYSVPVKVISPTPVHGTFTINNSQPTGGTNFNSFNEAYQFIKCGIDGPVVFNVMTGSGAYDEQLTMRAIPGASTVNTVTFKGDGTAAIGFASSTSSERAVIRLDGTKYIILDSLIINADAGTYGYGVQLMSNTDSNIVRNCTINLSLISSSTGFAGIVVSGSESSATGTGDVQCDGNIFEKNTIIGGHYGISLAATFDGGANGNNKILNNNITDFYEYGVYVAGSYNTVIEGNNFSRPSRADVGEFTGIYFTSQKNTGCLVVKNRIFNPFGGAPSSTEDFRGIFFSSSDGSSDAVNTVANNLIYDVNGNGPVYGIANTGSDYAWYFHNTISLDEISSTSTALTRGFYQTTTAGGLFFYNNIISITRGGTGEKHCIYLNANLVAGADHNDYYINAASGTNWIGYYDADLATLVDWRAATNLDANAISTIPAYIDPANGNYTPGNAGIDNMGISLGVGLITDDILGAVRSATTPDVGAYEFTPPPCSMPPVNGETLVSADTICQNSLVYLSMNIGAFGSAQTFQWEIATSETGPFTAMGTPMLTPDTTITADTTLYFRVAISCGTSTVYSDTVLLVVNPALPAGTYTINRNVPTNYVPGTAGGNFNTFADAIAAMGCGINGAVVFNVEPGTGPYEEQVILDSIAGTSVTSTITFNGNGNTIRFNSTESSERGVIKLNGADHIILDSLVVDASDGTYGFGVHLTNNADSNTVRKSTIKTSLTSSSTNFAGIVVSGSHTSAISTSNSWNDGNTFEGNTIIGGYYGIVLAGGSDEEEYINENRIINNTILDFYSYGTYIVGTYNTLVEGNTYSRPSRSSTASNLYGIYMTSEPSNRLRISKNRITKMFAASTSNSSFYGIRHNSVDATGGAENIVSNNLVYEIEGNGPQVGIQNTGSNNVRYYHNTISLDYDASTTSAATAGFYQTTSASGIELINNIITVRRGGSGNKHAIFMNTSSTDIVSDHNVLYVGGTNAHIGRSSGDQTTLADWTAETGYDVNSNSLDPLYVDLAAGNLQPQLGAIDNKGLDVGITTDIVGVARPASTPDAGAYEFSPLPCDVPPVAGTASVTPNSGICLETPITLDVTGHSALGAITFQWQYSPDGTTWTNIGPEQYFPQFDTVTTVNTYYRCAVTCNGNTTYTAVVQVMLNDVLLTGTYTIDNEAPATYVPGVAGGNFASFQSAVDALHCGITGPVLFNVAPGTYNEQIRIPYIPNMSAVNTVTFTSANGRADSVNLTFAATPSANYTLKLDSSRFFIFRNMTISGTDPVNGRVVEFAHTASHDSLLNCIINAPVASGTANNAAAVFASGIGGINLVIKGNSIHNGSNGIYLSGTSASPLMPGHIVDSNTVQDAYWHGIYVQYAGKIKVTNNTVHLNGEKGVNTAGIYMNYSDSAFRLTGNTVHINDVTSSPVYGIYAQNTRAEMTDSAIVASNTVIADSNNTGTVYGLTLAASKGISVVNNVVALNSAGATAYGLYHQNSSGAINYYNNTINLATDADNGFAGYFTQTATAQVNVYNNIFSNKGGGRALHVNNPARFSADYNLLYTSGASLVKVATGTTTEFANLKEWTNTWNWDPSSISHEPAFVATNDLHPDLNNPDVWAIHGRGLQIPGNTYDFNNNYRPQTRTEGVPDLGAYEFFPVALPSVLVATPATPASFATQTFSYGTDTVMRIKWHADVPAGITVRRYSGVVPDGLPAGLDSMYFYTQVEIPGGSDYDYAAKLYYINSWLGSIPNQSRLGLGRTTASNAWVIGSNSKVDVGRKEISQEAIKFLDRFTGLTNEFARPEDEDSSSNRGKDFWVGYQRTNGFTGSNGGGQTMKIYMGAGDIPANVTLTIEGTSGTPWVRNYFVPANSAVISDDIPKTGADDARLVDPGLYEKKGIHITSDVPIVAYAHIYESTNSGATMLMPTAVWGYEYYTLSSRQNYSSGSYSAFHVVAQEDSTWVEINPSNPARNGWVHNGGTQPNGSYLVKLNKGDAFQVLGEIISGSDGYDLSGSYVKSIANGQGECHPIAVFSGSTRTGIGCGTSPGSSGDLIIQQIFPYQAWGNKYATAPTSNQNGPNAGSNMTNIYRVMVKDPNTVVTVNGSQLTGLINNRYYQFESNTADYIESNKPVLVAQFMSSSNNCPNTSGDGDPEMFYLSPIQQAIEKTQFYRNDRTAIDLNFITLVIPKEGLGSLKIDGINYSAYPVAERFVYDHPNLPGYSVVTKKWVGGAGSSTVESAMPFTGIVYGLGSVESYGYNIGTLVKNLNNLSLVDNAYNNSNIPTEYTCKGAPFELTAYLPMVPESILWEFSKVPNLSPNVDSLQTNPVPVDTIVENGIEYYAFTLDGTFTFDTAGIIHIPIKYMSPDIEKCDMTQVGYIVVQVLPSMTADFDLVFGGNGLACAGVTTTFTGHEITNNGIAVSQWNWTFPDGSTPTGKEQTFTFPEGGTYSVKLTGITADGCISDTTRDIVINPIPVVTIAQEPVCEGEDATFIVQNPDPTSTYSWFDAPGGAPLSTGTSFTATNVTGGSEWYVLQVSAAGCNSALTPVTPAVQAPLPAPVVRADTIGTDMIRFAWDAIPNATAYEVSTDGGLNWGTPSSGATGLTHTMTGLQPLQSVTIIVKAIGCDEVLSAPVTAQVLPDGIYIPNAFTPNGDGLNDVLQVYSYKIKEMTFMVFNQWGEKIYESRTPAVAWDGTYKGKGQPSGVYMYVARMVLADGTVVQKKGSINLIR